MNGWTLIKLGFTEFVEREHDIDPWARMNPKSWRPATTLAEDRDKRKMFALQKPNDWLISMFETLVPIEDISDIPQSYFTPDNPLTPSKRKHDHQENHHPSQSFHVSKFQREQHQSRRKRVCMGNNRGSSNGSDSQDDDGDII